MSSAFKDLHHLIVVMEDGWILSVLPSFQLHSDFNEVLFSSVILLHPSARRSHRKRSQRERRRAVVH